MSLLAAASRRIGDAINPIVVRELRQAVRSRFVSGTLIVFLIIQLVVVWLYLMLRPESAAHFSGGRDVTGFLYGILIFSCLMFVPTYAGVRLAMERSDTQMDLMYTTSISPGAIIRGKLFGAAVIVLLIYSVCMPFMALSYLLRGVDLPSIFFMLFMGFVQVLAAAQVAIFLACIPMSRFLKILMGLGAFGLLLMSAFMGSISVGFVFTFGAPMDTPEFWAGLATWLVATGSGMGLLYFLSVAMISPPSANRALPVRLYVLGTWLILGALAVAWTVFDPASEAITTWAFFWVIFLSISLLAAVSERSSWGVGVRRRIPRSPVLRPLAFLFYTGSAGGVMFTVLLVAATMAVLHVVSLSIPRSLYVNWSAALEILLGIALYGFAYTVTAALVRGLLARRFPISCGYTWLIGMMLATLGMIAPYVVLFLQAIGQGSRNVFEETSWVFTNPFLLGQVEGRAMRLVVAGVWAILAAAASAPFVLRQFKAFRPLEPQAAAPPAAAPAGPESHA